MKRERLFKVEYSTKIGRVDYKVVAWSKLTEFGNTVRNNGGEIFSCKELNY